VVCRQPRRRFPDQLLRGLTQMARWCAALSAGRRDFLPPRRSSAVDSGRRVVAAGQQRSPNERGVVQRSRRVEACQTLAFYNQSSLKRRFQAHQPWVLVFSLLRVLVAISAVSVGRMGWFLSGGLGGGRRDCLFFFFLLSMEKTFPLKEGGMYSGRSNSLRSCFPRSP